MAARGEQGPACTERGLVCISVATPARLSEPHLQPLNTACPWSPLVLTGVCRSHSGRQTWGRGLRLRTTWVRAVVSWVPGTRSGRGVSSRHVALASQTPCPVGRVMARGGPDWYPLRQETQDRAPRARSKGSAGMPSRSKQGPKIRLG